MNDPKTYANAQHQLHPSGARALFTCPWRMVSQHLSVGQDGESGPAADTGSAMHAAAATFHRGFDPAEALAKMSAGIAKYPQADLRDATILALNYFSDRRNREEKVLLVEHPIGFTIAPMPDDVTGEPIHIIGTCDQVREIDGILYLCDLKTSKRDMEEIRHESTFQIAAYMVGASIALGREVSRGMILMPRRYGKDPSTSLVRGFYPWRLTDVEQLMLPIRQAVANVRAGRIWHVPSSECKWCHMRSPDSCLPQLQRTLKLLEVR